MTPRELAVYEQVQPPTVTRLMKALEHADLVTRRIHPTDRRQLILELTPAGNELLGAATKVTDHWLTTHLADLTDDERATLTTAIPIINKIVNASCLVRQEQHVPRETALRTGALIDLVNGDAGHAAIPPGSGE